MLKSICTAEDLITKYDEKKLGFLNIALRKSKEAKYYINLSNALRAETLSAPNAIDLLKNDNLLIALCEAAGVSSKARAFLETKALKEIVGNFFEEHILPLGNSYSEELVSRYLLTLGDSLGGRMRNIVGRLASEKLTETIISSIIIRSYKFKYLDKTSKVWIDGSNFSTDVSASVKGISWASDNGNRTLLYDKTVPLVRKNIDLVLLNTNLTKLNTNKIKEILKSYSNYLAFGELKGGIDPAGADEHWKTACTSLNRIRDAFNQQNHDIKTFFIGAAIENSMAIEMYKEVQSKNLSKCANLTKPNQLAEICNWLIGV